MKKSCSHCGRIHERSHVCSSRTKAVKKVTHIDRFRWTKVWQRKRQYIRERDSHLCQICLRMRHNTTDQYNFNQLEVHHIEPLASKDGWGKRLDDANLITLCRDHHEQAEAGTIEPFELMAITHENNKKFIM